MNKVELRKPAEIEEYLRRNLEQRKLPDCFLYVGNGGAENWLDLERSDGFQVASRLTQLLETHASTIADLMPVDGDLVSIGVGDGQKERLLLEALLPDWRAQYVAVDVSSNLVDAALNTVADFDIDAQGVVAFCEDLPELHDFWHSPVTLCLLGNNFCNYHPDDLLERVSAELSPEDLFLFDAHLRPQIPDGEEEWHRRVEDAYGSERNARFNIWPLVEHGMAPEACRFDIGLVRAETPMGMTYRTQKSIHVLKPGKLVFNDGDFQLDAGEEVEMGFTYKYTFEHLRGLLDAEGFEIVQDFCDENGENTLLLVQTC